MLLSFCIRIGNISPSAMQWHFHCENEEQKPQKLPPPLGRHWPPSNTAMPRPTARTTPKRSSDGWGTVAHVHCKVPIGDNGMPQIRAQKYLFPWTDPQTPPPASSMDPSNLWCQTPWGSDPPFSTMYWTDQQTDRPKYIRTYGQTDRSSTGKFDDYIPLRL